MVQRADSEPPFGLSNYTSYGTPLLTALDPLWRYRKMDFDSFVGTARRVVTMFHATSTRNPTVRLTNYVNPLTGHEAGWEPAVATAKAAVRLGSHPQAFFRGGEDAAWPSGEDGADDEEPLLPPRLDEESMRELQRVLALTHQRAGLAARAGCPRSTRPNNDGIRSSRLPPRIGEIFYASASSIFD